MKLKSGLNYKTTLYREVEGKVRYYSLTLYPTLFNEFLLVREFGGVKNKKPTRVIKAYFSNLDDSMKVFESLIGLKQKKGYRQIH